MQVQLNNEPNSSFFAEVRRCTDWANTAPPGTDLLPAEAAAQALAGQSSLRCSSVD